MFFYKGKKILVTGSTGFKGSWLSFWLHHLGADVIGYSLAPNTTPNLFEALKLGNKINQIIGDINNIDFFSDTVEKHKPEIIFHLAAQPLVKESYNDPLYTLQTNAIGTANVMEVIRKKDYIKGAVIITTDKVYENKEWIWPYRENDRLGGFDPYSTSKAMAELVVDTYQKSFLQHTDKKIAVVRAGNVIGGGDWSKDRLVPDIVKTIMSGEKLTLRNPNAVRPWQYVLEALYGYLIIGEKIFDDNKYIGAYNFGPDISDSLKVIDIVTSAITILGRGTYEIQSSPNQVHEAGILLLDNTKAKTLLNWTPKYNVQETLKRTLNWYQNYYSRFDDIEKISIAEIDEFKII